MVAGGKPDRGCSARVWGRHQGHPGVLDPSGGGHRAQARGCRGAGPRGRILHRNRAKRPWERSHAGGAAGPRQPRGTVALTPTAWSGGQGGLSGWILPPGRCLRVRWLTSRREQPFKGHRQRAALTTSAHICLRSKGRADSERGSAALSPPAAPYPGRILPPRWCCASLGTTGTAGLALSPHPIPTPQHRVRMLPWVRETECP